MKKRLRKTGEIVDVISFTAPCGANRSDINDFVSYVDSKGCEHENVPLNYYWDFEDIEEVKSTDIDWEQRRYEIGKDVLCSIVPIGNWNTSGGNTKTKFAVSMADALIAELKKGGK